MDIRAELLRAHSKEQTLKIVNYVGDDKGRFAELMDCMLMPVYRVSQRAAWPVSYCVERHPELIKPYWSKLEDQLRSDNAHVAVRRNVARLLQFVAIPERYQGPIFDVCSRLLADATQPVAVRCFSMTVAANIARSKPELLDELRLIAKQYPQAATAGFRSRARRVLGIE